MPPIFYRDASVILVCFDPTSPDVKASIRKWVDMLDEYRPEDSKIILVATKCDLWDNDDDPLIGRKSRQTEIEANPVSEEL